MATQQAYQNQTVTRYIWFFGPGGVMESGTVNSGTLVIGDGDPITCTIVGQNLVATVPANQELGLTTFAWSWNQTTLQGVTSDQGPITVDVEILGAPSGSSQSYVPANVARQCMRLAQPADTTVEQISTSGDVNIGYTLAVYINIPYSLLRSVAANLPSSGMDLVSFSYVDTLGQPGTLTINATLWMSDAGYCFISADNGTQFLIAGVRSNFFDDNAQLINTRNTNNAVTPLQPCANPARYGYNNPLPNQPVPSVWYYDGVLINGSSSSSF